MKKIVLLFVTILFSLSLSASDLVLIYTGDFQETRELFADDGLTIHYYTDNFVIATSDKDQVDGAVLITEGAFNNPEVSYFLLWMDSGQQAIQYTEEIDKHATILYSTQEFLLVSASVSDAVHLYPAIHGGMVRITSRAVQLPSQAPDRGIVSYRADIESMMGEVNQDSLEAYVQHLQDYGTRNAYTPESVQAQNWIFEKFTSFGLSVELHDFSMPGGAASDNVIATLTGTMYPDEYVVLGAHYDSYSFNGGAPGADDNATGTAGILEIARIMSQYTFDRTIIFGTWSGEEYGLYGSEAWAEEAAADAMNILGYFNMDMAGYLEPGDEIHTDIIAPASANELRQFYKDVCAIYLPDFEIFDGALSGGDSDHTSFNQNGYMGIFPFEDSQNYSPHIHTPNDIIGPSVNSFEMHATFTKAIIANVATMSDLLPSPENLVASAGDAEVSLAWTGLDSVEFYNIYRNNDSIPFDTTSNDYYLDTDVVNGESYLYFVTAVFSGTGEESGASNKVMVVPMPPISLPFLDDYETGGPYWTFEANWGLSQGIYHSATHSMTESPEGEYPANMDASATLRAIDLSTATTCQLSFWTRHRIEYNYDFMYLEVSTGGSEWDLIASYTGNQNTWGQKSYSLDDYVGEPNVMIRFRFHSDIYEEDEGMFIDDFEIVIDAVGIFTPDLTETDSWLEIHPNPSSGNTSINYYLPVEGNVSIYLVNSHGKMVMDIMDQECAQGWHHLDIDAATLSQGTYFLVMSGEGERTVKKLLILK